MPSFPALTSVYCCFLAAHLPGGWRSWWPFRSHNSYCWSFFFYFIFCFFQRERASYNTTVLLHYFSFPSASSCFSSPFELRFPSPSWENEERRWRMKKKRRLNFLLAASRISSVFDGTSLPKKRGKSSQYERMWSGSDSTLKLLVCRNTSIRSNFSSFFIFLQIQKKNSQENLCNFQIFHEFLPLF